MLPTPAFLLAGFILAHALFGASSLPPGKWFVPVAGVEAGQERKVLRFEAKDQAEALAAAASAIERATSTADSYAVAREGTADGSAGKQQAILLEVWTKGLDKPLQVVQPYARADGKSPFKVLGDPYIVVDGKPYDSPETKELLASLRDGLAQHPEVSKLLPGWKK